MFPENPDIKIAFAGTTNLGLSAGRKKLDSDFSLNSIFIHVFLQQLEKIKETNNKDKNKTETEIEKILGSKLKNILYFKNESGYKHRSSYNNPRYIYDVAIPLIKKIKQNPELKKIAEQVAAKLLKFRNVAKNKNTYHTVDVYCDSDKSQRQWLSNFINAVLKQDINNINKAANTRDWEHLIHNSAHFSDNYACKFESPDTYSGERSSFLNLINAFGAFKPAQEAVRYIIHRCSEEIKEIKEMKGNDKKTVRIRLEGYSRGGVIAMLAVKFLQKALKKQPELQKHLKIKIDLDVCDPVPGNGGYASKKYGYRLSNYVGDLSDCAVIDNVNIVVPTYKGYENGSKIENLFYAPIIPKLSKKSKCYISVVPTDHRGIIKYYNDNPIQKLQKMTANAISIDYKNKTEKTYRKGITGIGRFGLIRNPYFKNLLIDDDTKAPQKRDTFLNMEHYRRWLPTKKDMNFNADWYPKILFGSNRLYHDSNLSIVHAIEIPENNPVKDPKLIYQRLMLYLDLLEYRHGDSDYISEIQNKLKDIIKDEQNVKKVNDDKGKGEQENFEEDQVENKQKIEKLSAMQKALEEGLLETTSRHTRRALKFILQDPDQLFYMRDFPNNKMLKNVKTIFMVKTYDSYNALPQNRARLNLKNKALNEIFNKLFDTKPTDEIIEEIKKIIVNENEKSNCKALKSLLDDKFISKAIKEKDFGFIPHGPYKGQSQLLLKLHILANKETQWKKYACVGEKFDAKKCGVFFEDLIRNYGFTVEECKSHLKVLLKNQENQENQKAQEQINILFDQQKNNAKNIISDLSRVISREKNIPGLRGTTYDAIKAVVNSGNVNNDVQKWLKIRDILDSRAENRGFWSKASRSKVTDELFKIIKTNSSFDYKSSFAQDIVKFQEERLKTYQANDRIPQNN